MATVDSATPTPQRLLELQRPLQLAQWAAILGSLVVGLWSVAGLVANPDFATGDSATAERVLAVDMNGWHALSGFLVAIPGLFAALRPDWSALFNLAAAGSLIATGVWALIDAQVAGGLLYLPNGTADALLHFGTAAIFIAGAAHYFLAERA
jgi:Domain of unknown function (DUF4383)